MYMRPDTAMAILMPLTLWIPHLVDIDGAFVETRREPAGIWKASDSEITRQLLAAYNVSIDPLPPGRA